MATHVIEGPTPPRGLKGHARLVWLRNHNPHLYWHEEVRLSKVRLARIRYVYGPNSTRLADEQSYLDRYVADLEAYHRGHPETA